MEIALPAHLVITAPKKSSCCLLDGVSMWL